MSGGKDGTWVKDYIIIATAACMSFGDSVELYIPAAITLPVSCELGLSNIQKIYLGLSLYVSLFAFSFTILPSVKLLGVRKLIILVLYLGVIFTVMCALVPNYFTLILSRVLLGATIVLIYNTLSIYVSSVIKNKGRQVIGLTVVGWAMSIGGGWVGILAYISLEALGWRWFVLLTSLPFFAGPIIVFHFYLHDDVEYGGKAEYEAIPSSEEAADGSIPRKNCERNAITAMVILVVSLVLRTSFSSGSILLLPEIIKHFNVANGLFDEDCGSVHGSQFLLFTVQFGVSHGLGNLFAIIGKSLGLSAIASLLIPSMVCFSGSLILAFTWNNFALIMVAVAVVQTFSPMMGLQQFFLMYDDDVVGRKYKVISSMMYYAAWYGGTLLGNLLSITLPFSTVLTLYPFISGLLVLTVPLLKVMVPSIH